LGRGSPNGARDKRGAGETIRSQRWAGTGQLDANKKKIKETVGKEVKKLSYGEGAISRAPGVLISRTGTNDTQSKTKGRMSMGGTIRKRRGESHVK